MHTTHAPNGTAPTPHSGVRGLCNGLAERLERFTPHSLIALAARLALAGIFWMSGRTKVEGVFTITDTTYLLFREEYKLPLIPPEWAAQMATVAEHVFPVLLVLGLFTRLSALALLGMTLVIQVFVYPDAFPTHGMWAVALLYLMARGPGTVSLDALLARVGTRRR